MDYTIGLDIGGTKIAAGIIDSAGNILVRKKFPSKTEDSESMFDQVVYTITSLISDFEGSVDDIKGIGVGLPGKVNREEGIAVFQNNLPWENFPLKQRLNACYPQMSISVENDVAAAAFGEHFLNTIEKDKLFTYITLSTGVASATIMNNTLLQGHGFSGELGLIPVKAGLDNNQMRTLEECTSGVAIAEYGKEYFEDATLTTEDVFDNYYDGHDKAHMIIKQAAKSLAYGFVSVISLLDPDVIIVGGSVAMHHPVMIDLVKGYLGDLLIEAQLDAISRIHLSSKADSAIIGAASRLL